VEASFKILVADDHEVVREGLRALLEKQPGWTVCAEASNGREAVERAVALRPDVVIMDLAMPELNGLEATRSILRESPRTAILILSARDSEELVREVLAAGARGFVLKTDAARDLVVAVEGLRHGRPFFSARVAELVLRGFLQGGLVVELDRNRPPALTVREREVLQLLAEGHSNKEVAATLSIGVKTAEAHRANLMRKLAVRSIPDLVRYAIRNHLVEP
jgi:DNA-binding NarL/FixJ family response regulator